MAERKTYGVRTLAEFKALFEVCAETGCWLLIDREERKHLLKVRLLPIGKRVTTARAGFYLTTGKEAPPDKVLARECDTEHCGNPAHHKVIKRGKHQERGVKRSVVTRARIAMAMRAKSRLGMTLELAAEIRQSDETGEAIAARLRISRSLVWKIRAGKAWAPLVQGASVFSLATR